MRNIIKYIYRFFKKKIPANDDCKQDKLDYPKNISVKINACNVKKINLNKPDIKPISPKSNTCSRVIY